MYKHTNNNSFVCREVGESRVLCVESSTQASERWIFTSKSQLWAGVETTGNVVGSFGFFLSFKPKWSW